MTDHRATSTIAGWVLNLSDDTERMHAEEALTRMAMHDSLTGLPNRAQLLDRLEHTISRHPGATALLFCDLDGFKQVNDTLGHKSGDELLRGIAGRWSECLRADDILGRWGGDEFLIVCEQVLSMEQVRHIGNRLVDTAAIPVDLPDGVVSVGTSVGLALHRPGESVDDFIARADTAMYAAKRARGGLHVAAP